MAVGEAVRRRRVGVGVLPLFNRARYRARARPRSVVLAGKDGKPRRFAYAEFSLHALPDW
jgi:hypothetical protein